MAKANTRTEPSLERVESLLNEVDEHHERFNKIGQKLRRLRRGREAYLDFLADLDVRFFTLKLKVEHAHEARRL